MSMNWPLISVGLDMTQQPEPQSFPILLNFTEADCAMLHSALGDYFNLRFFAHCVQSIVGAPGRLCLRRTLQPACLSDSIELLASTNAHLDYCFRLDKPEVPVEGTFISLTEMSKAASVGDRSSQASVSLRTGETPSLFSDAALNDIGLDVGPLVEMQFETTSSKRRQAHLRKDVAARDGECRLTGSVLNFCNAAHLFKACNPDQVRFRAVCLSGTF